AIASRTLRGALPISASAPEAGQVARGLDGAMGGGEQDQQQRHPAAGNRGMTVEAEEFLHADFQCRAIFGGIVDGQAIARWRGKRSEEHTSELQSREK